MRYIYIYTYIHRHNGVLFGHKKKENFVICSKKDDTEDNHIKQIIQTWGKTYLVSYMESRCLFEGCRIKDMKVKGRRF